MRRAVATLVVALTGFVPLSPALVSTSDSNLPACCHRGGAHHCSTEAQPDSTGGASIAAVQTKCPLYPKSTAAVRGQDFAIAASSKTHAPEAAAQRAAIGEKEVPPAQFDHSPHKRGPPA